MIPLVGSPVVKKAPATAFNAPIDRGFGRFINDFDWMNGRHSFWSGLMSIKQQVHGAQ